MRLHFEVFGEIIEIDIKKQGTSTYAFIQYSDICSVVKAMRKLDGENLGNSSNRIKLGFGKSMPAACTWIHSVTKITNESVLRELSGYNQVSFRQVVNLAIDRSRRNCLETYASVDPASSVLTQLKSRMSSSNGRLQADFASPECQTVS